MAKKGTRKKKKKTINQLLNDLENIKERQPFARTTVKIKSKKAYDRKKSKKSWKAEVTKGKYNASLF